MSNTKSYLQKKYKDYSRSGVPVENLRSETLANQLEYSELRKTVSSVTGVRCPKLIPLPVFLFVVMDFLK